MIGAGVAFLVHRHRQHAQIGFVAGEHDLMHRGLVGRHFDVFAGIGHALVIGFGEFLRRWRLLGPVGRDHLKGVFRLLFVELRSDVGLSRLAEAIVTYEDNDSIQVNQIEFNNLPDNVRPSLLVFLVKRLSPAHPLTKVNVAKAVEFLQDGNSGSQMNLPGGLHLINTYDTFVITSKPKEFKLEGDDNLHVFNLEKPFANDFFKLSLSHSDQTPIRVPMQKLYVRYRQPGDRVQPIGMKGSKKLQDVFVDAKVPKHLRDLWPVVVTSGNEIVWVPNLVKDRRFFDIKADKYQFLNCEVI